MMSLKIFVIIMMLSTLNMAQSYIQSNILSIMNIKINRIRRVDTNLNLDFFGLGPAEIVVIGVAAAVLFGPDKIKEQLRESGVKNSVVLSDDPETSRAKKIREMKEYATKRRKERAWERINMAIENEDENILSKMDEFNKRYEE